MARVPDKIKLIDGSRETLKLSVRITDLWFIGIPEKSEQAEMMVVDSDGYEIHVVCKQDQLKSWKADLKENLTYVMHNFKVMKNDGKFRICGHEYKLYFTGVIVVRQCNMEHLPFRKFRFVDFSTIIAGHFETGLLGCFQIKGFEFLSYLNEVEDERPIVILLTHARIKEAQGSYPSSVSNSFKASKLMINELVLEIQEFRESLLNLGIEVRSVLTPIGHENAFLSKAEAKNISQINDIYEEIVCVTVVKITTIVMDNHSWCYPACSQCHKKTDIETMSFTCPCGKDNDQPVLRYRVKVMDRECAELIGQSADEVNRLKIEDGDVDLNASLQVLDRLLDCFLAFKVKVQPRFRNAVVLRYSDESNLINVVLDMLPDTEQSMFITSDDDRSMLDSTEPTELESQFVSVTADNDPLLRIPLTPTKRASFDELDDGPKNFEISHAKVSSNKLAKLCQPE
ncbi:hypothetical protein D0Y65_023325 [Glycine soja]|uniref:Replication protein A 70 kDa DNA-binding subunit B/D first OB fold domain-containing protein n=1 Tax=Glycine soja TaxID=3848 RepID=A0A445IXG6_GLYSO|nr:hypothetical protein JHK86_024244 [Glycine max]RZB90844.1 hypothetical protein D0Y65_023325 [Glycine soja]